MITTPTSASNVASTFDVAGHGADLLFDTVNVLNSTASTGDSSTNSYTSTFSFDRGTLDATIFNIGHKTTGSLNITANATANIGSAGNFTNTASLGAVQMGQHTTTTGGTANGILNSTLSIAGTATTVTFGTLKMANSTTNDADTEVDSKVNISGGSVTGTGGINMLAALTAGTASSTLTISGGSLSVGTGGVSATNGIYRGAATGTTTLVLNGGSLDLNGNAIGAAGANAITTQFESGTLTDVGEINGGTGLTKTTSGTLNLTGTNTYTGATNVNAGTLVVGSGGTTAAASAVTVGAGTLTGTPVATIGGSGTINGTLNLAGESAAGFKNGGVLSPGATAGDIQTLNAGTTTWNGGSIWNFDLSSTTNTSDQLVITGDLVKGTGTGFEFNFMGSTPLWNTTYTLATWSSLIPTNFAVGDFSFTGLGAGPYGTSGFTLNDNSLTFTAVPEPTSALAGLLLTAGLLRRRRNVGF
jgi:autotransporter-associated beta strand protein